MKKMLLLLLIVCMTGSAFVSCGVEESPVKESEQITSTYIESESLQPEIPLEIPDIRYDKETLVFLTREDGEWSSVEIFAEEGSTDNISYAVYERNDIIYQKYGVVVSEYRLGSTEHQQTVKNEVSAPTGDFKAVSTSTSVASNMVTNGLLKDLNSEENLYLDTSKPWWDQSMAQGMEIDGRLFMVTGDIMTLDNDATFAIMFNKTIAEACHLTDIYEKVANYEWTMDLMYEYEQLAVSDVDGDGKLAYNSDVSGFAYTVDTPYCLMYAGNVQVVGHDGENNLVYILDAERTQNIADKCKNLLSSSYSTNLTANKDGVPIVEAGKTCFSGGHALFFGECLQCVTRMRGYDIDFGILPYPMYDQNQGMYRSLMHSTGSVVCIPQSVKDGDQMDMVTSMIEAMAYYSVDTLTEQYYEVNLTTKNVKDEQSGPMIDLIMANRACDLAYYFGWGNAVSEISSALLPGSGSGVVSKSAAYKRSVERAINNMLDKMNS